MPRAVIMRICIVGLGRMGRGMAINLVNRGHVVYGYDIIPVSISNVSIVRDINQCNNMDFTILALPTGREVIDVLNKVPSDPGIILDTTTMGLDELENVLSIVKGKNLKYLTVRVERGPKDAERGDLVLFVGGDEGLYRNSEELLKQLGTPIYIGTHEQATALKLISTTVLITNTLVLAEASRAIQELGLDKDVVIKALSMSGADSAQLRTRLPWILSDNYPESFSIELASYVVEKFIRYMADLGASTPIVSVVQRLLRDGRAMGYGKRDFSEVARLIRS